VAKARRSSPSVDCIVRGKNVHSLASQQRPASFEFTETAIQPNQFGEATIRRPIPRKTATVQPTLILDTPIRNGPIRSGKPLVPRTIIMQTQVCISLDVSTEFLGLCRKSQTKSARNSGLLFGIMDYADWRYADSLHAVLYRRSEDLNRPEFSAQGSTPPPKTAPVAGRQRPTRWSSRRFAAAAGSARCGLE
jgi:hypothetical protein